ncbi:glycosyltransferase-like domain-containing protein 1 [Cryptotermes secundus]|uniref:glycosyltransferase-like domain-containing protein 1 n=1 Tax=Cryptotermes secundus TaxID=105785 RepID=UPI001454CBD8|nr:glycosyltransferase-like domain-containing protein 1 [Cryptotermes secundus]
MACPQVANGEVALQVHRIRDVRQREMHTAEPLIPAASPFGVEIAIAKVRMYKSPGSDQILAVLVEAGDLLTYLGKLKLYSIVYNFNFQSCGCIILFNSNYNQDSLLDSISKFLKLQPEFRPKDLKEQIAPKCRVLYFPLKFPSLGPLRDSDNTVLHLVWPHRWEYDKVPATFFHVLLMLVDAGLNFYVSVLGVIINSFSRLEAKYYGCFPLCQNALVYPDPYPNECLYRRVQQLLKMVENFCQNPNLARHMRHSLKMDSKRFSAEYLFNEYKHVLLLHL